MFLGTALIMTHSDNLSAQTKTTIPYPPTRQDKVVDTLHGVEVSDPYRWLEAAVNPEAVKWVEQENALTRSVLDKLAGRQAIAKRLDRLLEIGSITAPRPAKGRLFFAKREGTQNQPIYYVREGLHGKDRVLLDPNVLAKDGTVAVDW